MIVNGSDSWLVTLAFKPEPPRLHNLHTPEPATLPGACGQEGQGVAHALATWVVHVDIVKSPQTHG